MNAEGLALLKSFEGFEKVIDDPNVAHSYWDAIGGVFTGPWGFTDGVKEGMTWTRAQADALLIAKLEPYERAVRIACKIEPNENQLAALTVCAWNIGIEGMKRSSMIKAHNRGDINAAARAFGLWNRSGSKVIAGLTRRRAAEAALYLKPVGVHGARPVALEMPQQVDGETNLARSPIIAGSTIAGATATVGAVSQGSQAIHDIKENLGDMLPWVIAICAVAVSAYVVWQRIKQRRGGSI